MNKYAVSVVGVANLTVGEYTLDRSTTPHVVYLTDAQYSSLAPLVSAGKISIAETEAGVAVNEQEPGIVDDIAVRALTVAQGATAQLAHIAQYGGAIWD